MFDEENDEGWLEISNIEKFSDYIRNIVYINFKDDSITDEDDINIDIAFEDLTDEEKKEIASILDKQECINIVKETSRKVRGKKSKKIKYLMDDKILYDIIDNINQRMVSNIIANMVKKGLLETAFDEKKNDFIFWKKDNSDGNSQADKF